VIRLTGKPFSTQRAGWKHALQTPNSKLQKSSNHQAPRSFCFARSSEDRRRRIDQRVDQMFRDGLVAETERLLECGLDRNRTAVQALGYRQVIEHLRGVRSLPETIELVKTRTRQFAKRQMTWFRGQMELTWLNLEQSESADVIKDRLLRALG
jgi:tRNA dimethylallyltransferase